ncbi:MAG: hypothetical protein FJY39_01070 [Betaproteobacteria bacterium]|nr:hypothetical protein [Betaproteobacteria bacterium]
MQIVIRQSAQSFSFVGLRSARTRVQQRLGAYEDFIVSVQVSVDLEASGEGGLRARCEIRVRTSSDGTWELAVSDSISVRAFESALQQVVERLKASYAERLLSEDENEQELAAGA